MDKNVAGMASGSVYRSLKSGEVKNCGRFAGNATPNPVMWPQRDEQDLRGRMYSLPPVAPVRNAERGRFPDLWIAGRGESVFIELILKTTRWATHTKILFLTDAEKGQHLTSRDMWYLKDQDGKRILPIKFETSPVSCSYFLIPSARMKNWSHPNKKSLILITDSLSDEFPALYVSINQCSIK